MRKCIKALFTNSIAKVKKSTNIFKKDISIKVVGMKGIILPFNKPENSINQSQRICYAFQLMKILENLVIIIHQDLS